MTEDAPKSRYLYCIIRSDEPRTFASRGIGEFDGDVYTVHGDDLAAVISGSPVVDYERTRQNMMAHEAVLDEVMREFTVLPIRFGTIAPDEDAIIAKLLKRRRVEFEELLSEMADKKELGIKAFWREDGLFREIAEERPEIRRLRDSLAGESVEKTYYERIRLGEMVEKAMGEKREDDAGRILDCLTPVSCRSRVNAPLGKQMILNAAFLVEKAREGEFDGAVQQLDREMGERMVLRYVGAVPPYNFVNIIVNWGA